jgi:VWFA-related protein
MRRVLSRGSIALLLACSSCIAEAQSTTAPVQPQTQLKVESNLVIVTAVVRDEHGRPVEGLRKEDFRLLDQGKEQSLSQFEWSPGDASPAESPTPASAQVSAASPQKENGQASPARFFAFYFDNLNASEADLMQARDAADRYMAGNLKPADRIAIFTSDKMLCDFTPDAQLIHKALFQLQPSALNRDRGAPGAFESREISDYQALEMLQTDNLRDNAWIVALGHSPSAPNTVPSNSPLPDDQAGRAQSSNSPQVQELKMRARAVAAAAAEQSRVNLDQLQQVTRYIAQAPGERTVILVSQGFLSQSEQSRLDRVTDVALRSQVVINSIDPKGLAVTMREADATRNTFSPDPQVNMARHQLEAAREVTAADVLVEFAEGTGGLFIHNDNDLQGGFGRLLGRQAHYILAFSPRELKRDGKYHELKLTLVNKPRGVSIQARRGYFAPSKTPDASASVVAASAPAAADTFTVQLAADAVAQSVPSAAPPGNNAPSAGDATNQLQNRIQQALSSKEELTQLPIGIQLIPPGAQAADATQQFAVLTHLDIKPIHPRKDSGRNVDTITFTVAILDPSGTQVAAKQRSVKLNATDDQYAELMDNGIEVTTKFELKPGRYQVRAVVTESEEGKLAATSVDAIVP